MALRTQVTVAFPALRTFVVPRHTVTPARIPCDVLPRAVAVPAPGAVTVTIAPVAVTFGRVARRAGAAAGVLGPAGEIGPSAMINTGGWISVAEASPAATTTVTTFGDVTISLSCQAQSGYTDIKVRGIATGTGAGFGSSGMSGWQWTAFVQNTETDIYGQSPGGSAVETRTLLYPVLASDGQTRLLSGFLRLDRTVSPAICKISLGS